MVVATDTRLTRLYPLIRQISAKVGLQRTRTGSDLNLTCLQIEALSAVDARGNLTMTELSRGLVIVQSSATRISDELVKRGLLKRGSDRDDRRVVRLRMTPKGREVLEQVRQEGSVLLGLVLDKMTGEQQETLINGLEVFIAAVAATEREVLLNCGREECTQLVQTA